jgi:hypothetical protein
LLVVDAMRSEGDGVAILLIAILLHSEAYSFRYILPVGTQGFLELPFGHLRLRDGVRPVSGCEKVGSAAAGWSAERKSPATNKQRERNHKVSAPPRSLTFQLVCVSVCLCVHVCVAAFGGSTQHAEDTVEYEGAQVQPQQLKTPIERHEKYVDRLHSNGHTASNGKKIPHKISLCKIMLISPQYTHTHTYTHAGWGISTKIYLTPKLVIYHLDFTV